MNSFWAHQENTLEGNGYGQFSKTHIFLLTISILFIIAIINIYLNAGDSKIIILRTISATLMISEILKLIALPRAEASIINNLPLEVCSFAGYAILFDSLYPTNKVVPMMLLTLFLPAAIMALLFPTTTRLPAFNFFTIHQFVFHALIIAYVLMRFINKEWTLTYQGLWMSIIKVIILVAIIYTIDTIFDRNFFFLRGTEGNAALESIKKLSQNNIGYTLGLICFAIISLHIFFIIFKIIEIVFLK